MELLHVNCWEACLNSLAATRLSLKHTANSLPKYKLYFAYLHEKIRKYHLRASDIYNMDEKGFHLGRGEGSTRIFSRDLWESGGCWQPIADGNREWMTVIAAVCADGSALPPSVLYAATSSNIQERW
ncbi:hypothetical protein CC86DRAFT_426990, partial [Ophiobolus disseminans]